MAEAYIHRAVGELRQKLAAVGATSRASAERTSDRRGPDRSLATSIEAAIAAAAHG